MSNERSNESQADKNSSTGNSGLLGLCSVKPRLQPIRIKAFLDMYGSDDEDSEDKGKESSSDSECEDLPPLPEESEDKVPEERPAEVGESGPPQGEGKLSGESTGVEEKISIFQNTNTIVKRENVVSVDRFSSRFTDNFTSGEQCKIERSHSQQESHHSRRHSERPAMKSEIPGGSSVPTEPGRLSDPCSSKSTTCEQLLSTAKRAMSEISSVEESSVDTRRCEWKPSDVGRIEKTHSDVGRMERMHTDCGRMERMHSDLVRSERGHPDAMRVEKMHSEPLLSFAESREPGHFQKESNSQSSHVTATPNSRLVTETPMKNNPPTGSMRPTPSMSHRSIFQTPQDSKLPTDYSKNYTPATIFGNWSATHMKQTPLQTRLTSDSSRPSSIVPQYASHDIPLQRGTDEKKVRRPLVETMISNPAGQNGRSSVSIEKSNDKRSINPTIHESKGNDSIDRYSIKEEPPVRQKSLADNNKMTSREIFKNHNTKESVDSSKPSGYPQNYRPAKQVIATAPEKENVPESRNNVQASVPFRIQRSRLGQTIVVKGKEYYMLGSLGQGMSGQVYRVQDLGSQELRAIKIVDLERLDKDCAQGCLQEVTMLHKLQAPCIVTMFDYEIKGSMLHVVMEMGDTDFRSLLGSMLESKKGLPLTMILYYWTEMLTAVGHIHKNGVIHSDLKPANFLLVRGRLKLIDFGIASSMNPEMTSVVKSNTIGTMNYISPEALTDVGGDSPNQNVKYKISFKSDVWSLGCILYSLVYGYTPFQNMRSQWAKCSAIMNPHKTISYPSTTASNEPTPPILIDVLRKCLQHDPKARPTVDKLLQVPYIPINPSLPCRGPDIPPNILGKVKSALTDNEWRQFIETLDARRNP